MDGPLVDVPRFVKSVALIVLLFASAAFAAKSDTSSECDRERAAAVKQASGACKIQYQKAVQEAGMDKAERDIAAAELRECVKKARAKDHSLKTKCASSFEY